MEELKEWLIDKKDLIRLREVERRAGIPETTLSLWIADKRELPSGHLSPVIEVLRQLGFNTSKLLNQKITTMNREAIFAKWLTEAEGFKVSYGTAGSYLEMIRGVGRKFRTNVFEMSAPMLDILDAHIWQIKNSTADRDKKYDLAKTLSALRSYGKFLEFHPV